MSNEPRDEIKQKNVDPELLVRYYKYYRQQTNPYVVNPISFKFIKTLSYYKENKKYFDKLADVIVKYNINHVKYIKFCIFERKIKNGKELLEIENFSRYAQFLKLKEQYHKIYTQYVKTANYIAEECMRQNISVVQFIKNLIVENRLAYEYITGRISKYYIVSIQNFKKLYYKLDHINQDELRIILNVSDELNHDIQDAFMMFKSQRVKPIRFTEELLKRKLLNKEY